MKHPVAAQDNDAQGGLTCARLESRMRPAAGDLQADITGEWAHKRGGTSK